MRNSTTTTPGPAVSTPAQAGSAGSEIFLFIVKPSKFNFITLLFYFLASPTAPAMTRAPAAPTTRTRVGATPATTSTRRRSQSAPGRAALALEIHFF